MWWDVRVRRTIALTGARPVTVDMETERRPGVQCRAVVRHSHLVYRIFRRPPRPTLGGSVHWLELRISCGIALITSTGPSTSYASHDEPPPPSARWVSFERQ